MSGNEPPRRRGPVVIEYGPGPARGEDRGDERGIAGVGESGTSAGRDALNPAEAPPILDAPEPPPSGQAMQVAARLAARKASLPLRLFLGAGGTLLGLVLTLAAWDYVTGLLARSPVLGGLAAGLLALTLLAFAALALREAAAYARLRRLDDLRRSAEAALATADLRAAGAVVDRLDALYSARPEMQRGRGLLQERSGDVFDADGLLGLAEAQLLAPLDAEARREVEVAARLVATVTAVVPLALADVAAALFANLRMIRRIAEIYGGRAGMLGGWRLTRSVLTHLVATGVVAAGDDLIGSMAGGGLLAKLSRRFGEGVVNGALTARVGVAAMEVCRPLPFRAAPAPRVSNLISRALTGLFDKQK